MSCSHPTRWIAVLVCALAVFGCAGSGTEQSDTGSLSLELVLGDGIVINQVDWAISGNDMEPMSGTIDTSAPGATASVEVFGLPPGENYLVELEATSEDGDTTCRGSAEFDVSVGEVTPVMVMLNCKRPERLGGVRVNGEFNICAELAKVVISPLQTSVGNDIDLSAAGSDVEGDPIAFVWSATGGTIANPSATSTTYTCSEVGEQLITITISDDGFEYCMDDWVVAVTCVEGEDGTGGTGGAGGEGGEGGTGGTAGAGGEGGAGGMAGAGGGGTGGTAGAGGAGCTVPAPVDAPGIPMACRNSFNQAVSTFPINLENVTASDCILDGQPVDFDIDPVIALDTAFLQAAVETLCATGSLLTVADVNAAQVSIDSVAGATCTEVLSGPIAQADVVLDITALPAGCNCSTTPCTSVTVNSGISLPLPPVTLSCGAAGTAGSEVQICSTGQIPLAISLSNPPPPPAYQQTYVGVAAGIATVAFACNTSSTTNPAPGTEVSCMAPNPSGPCDDTVGAGNVGATPFPTSNCDFSDGFPGTCETVPVAVDPSTVCATFTVQ